MSEPIKVFVVADEHGDILGLFRNVYAIDAHHPILTDVAKRAMRNPGTWEGLGDDDNMAVAYMTVETA